MDTFGRGAKMKLVVNMIMGSMMTAFGEGTPAVAAGAMPFGYLRTAAPALSPNVDDQPIILSLSQAVLVTLSPHPTKHQNLIHISRIGNAQFLT